MEIINSEFICESLFSNYIAACVDSFTNSAAVATLHSIAVISPYYEILRAKPLHRNLI